MTIRTLRLLVAAAALGGCRKADAPPEEPPRTVSTPAARGSPERSAGDLVITTTDGKVDLVLARDKVVMKLSADALRKVREETGAGAAERSGSDVEAQLERLVRQGVRDALSRRIEYPLAEIEDARYEDGALKFTYRGGRRLLAFENVKLNRAPVLESFAPADAERFAAAVRAAKGGREAIGAASGGRRREGTMTMTLTSTAFTSGGSIPSTYTCDGRDAAPPLAWSGAPSGTQSFALIVDDPDAPDPKAPKTTWVHWVLYNIPATVSSLPEGAASRDLPAGSREGRNDWKRTGYGGPCPPVGRHRYFHKLYALDTTLPDLGTPTKAKLEGAMAGHVLAQAELVGTYQRSK